MIVLGEADPDTGFADFRARETGNPPAFDPESLTLDAGRYALAYDGAFRIDGTECPFAPLSPVPHISHDGGGLRTWTSLR